VVSITRRLSQTGTLSLMAHAGWTREQLVKALSLYCQIPFGKIDRRNPTIMALAAAIGRTPSAVSLKLVNFASLDPELRGRGIGGMGNTSKADRDVWAEFYGRWDVLAENAVVVEVPPAPPEATSGAKRQRKAPAVAPIGPTEVPREVAQRRGQNFFRAAVFAAHDYKCCITGITCDALLRASHIVPWASDETLRLDPRNGLCLNALHDAAFDRGLITFTDQFELKLSKRLKAEVPEPIYAEMFEDRVGTPIAMPKRFKPSVEMMEVHRSKVFRA